MCFLFKQKTAYELRISDWSSDVCSSDLNVVGAEFDIGQALRGVAAHQHQPPAFGPAAGVERLEKIGRASCRESVCQYVEISVDAVSIQKKQNNYLILQDDI